jgi:hypothetical protein
MQHVKKTLITTAILLTATTSGCASRSDITDIRKDVMEARRSADKALALSEEANRRSEHTEEMLNRGFRHSMRK